MNFFNVSLGPRITNRALCNIEPLIVDYSVKMERPGRKLKSGGMYSLSTTLNVLRLMMFNTSRFVAFKFSGVLLPE